MGRYTAEYIMVAVVVLTAAYLVVTPIAHAVGDSLNQSAELVATSGR